MVASQSSLDTIKASLKEKVFLGNEPTPELIAILIVYFVQGILGLASLAISFFLKDDLGLSPAQVAALTGIAVLPWGVKPLYGLLSDGLPLFGYRRRSYLILSGLMGTAAWLGFATVVNNAWTATIALLVSSLSVAISDVIADSLVVERARKESLTDSGSLQSLCWGTSALGGLITAYLSGWLLQQLNTHTVFAITATFPLLVSAVAWLIAEEPINARPDVSTVWNQVKQLRGAMSRKAIWLPVAFVFIWQATPSAGSAFFYFSTNELGFEPEFLGRVRIVTSVAALVGVWVFQRFLRNVPFRTIFGWSAVISTVLGLTPLILVTHANRSLGIDDHWFSLGDSLILSVMGRIAFMPIMVLAARLCPEGVEATLFALLMSINNVGGLLSHELGALLTQWLGVTGMNFDNLWLLLVITNISNLLPLPFLGWLPATDPQAEIEATQTHKSLPPGEMFEHHSMGSIAEQPFLPDLLPELMRTGERLTQNRVSQPAEEPAE
jgi:folate/biopterin transporter